MALLPLLHLLLASSAAAEVSRPPATALFVLGDSTVSCATTTLPLNLTAPSLSGPCLFPSSRRLLPDLLAAKMGLPPPPLISTLNGTAAAMAGGVNFGGQYGERGGVFRVGAAVGQQLRMAAETLQLLQLEAATSRSAAEGTAEAVFVLSFGADAYARLLARGPAADAAAPKHGRRGFGRILADRITRTELYEADVRRVAVMGVAPLGCAPRVMWEGMHVLNGRSCVDEANELIQGYNARLAAQLDDLRTRLPDADIVFCDVNKGMMEIISNPGKYGFEEAREACCGLGPFKASMGCFSKEMACRSPERRVWWDLYSPTEAVDALIMNWSWSVLPGSEMSICSPIALHQLTGLPA